MCGLFGLYIYGDVKKDYSHLLNKLARYSAERGEHATGIAYVHNDVLTVYKRPLSAYKMDFKHLSDVRCITGHTRHATQGKAQDNYNNHPFVGHCRNADFALSHNGVIYNDNELQRKYSLPKTKILTDSYIAVQLLEKYKKLSPGNIAKAVEALDGYYSFTILTGNNDLHIVKGDSPISIVDIKPLKMLIYASTDSILYNSLISANMFDYITTKQFDIVPISDGQILTISVNGKREYNTFKMPEPLYNLKNWYDYDYTDTTAHDEYYDDILFFAQQYGLTEDDIHELLASGYTLDDIEDYLYTGDTVC